MHVRKHKNRLKPSSRRSSISVLVASTILGLTAGVASANLVYRLAAVPNVGDIIAFNMGRQASYGFVDGRVLAARHGQDGCAIDPEALRQTGGSLIVEERLGGATPTFRVHWAGLRTTGDQGNCGADADLLLRAADLAMLAAAAGGYGVVKPPVLPNPWMDAAAIP